MKYKILIIDDEAQSRTKLCNCVSWDQLGFELAGQAANGRMALDFLKNNTVHVLLSDIRMPFMDGIELAKQLHTRKNSPIIIFFSGYRDFEYAQQALAYGVRLYLLKPIKYEDIIQTFTNIKLELDQKYGNTKVSLNPTEPDSFIVNVASYVNNNLATASLKGLSQCLYMNSSYVSQLYKQKTGHNFVDYLTEVRMKKAAELLETSSKPIYAISKMIGYSNPKYFTRAFLAYHGTTPSDYRHIHKVNITPKETNHELVKQ